MFITKWVVHMFFNKPFILASNSSSRFNLLKNAGLSFTKIKPLCNEELLKKQYSNKIRITNLPKLLAKEKAKSVSTKKPNKLVVGSDTIIIFKNKTVNKARTIDEARKKLKKLSGKKHQIISAASVCLNEKEIWHFKQISTIELRELTDQQINKYLKKTGSDILSSVGCYQVERLGPQIIKSIRGDLFNVLGFPLFPFLNFLSKV